MVPSTPLLIVAGILLARAFLPVDSIAPCEGTNQIDAFAVQIEGQLKRKELRTFAETYSQQGPIWREVNRGRESTGTMADVYVSGGVPAAAFFTIQTLSGDWVLYADYYFRPDGSLAKMHERLNVFHTSASVVRDTWFGCHGEAYGGTVHHFDLKTKKPRQSDSESSDERAPIFTRIQNLPFFSALRSRSQAK
jgi:hypothetical protein